MSVSSVYDFAASGQRFSNFRRAVPRSSTNFQAANAIAMATAETRDT